MKTWSRSLVCIVGVVTIFTFSTYQVIAKDWHFKSVGHVSHIVRSIKNTKGHVHLLCEIDIGRVHQTRFIIDALLKGILWDLPVALLRDARIIE